MKLVVQNLRVKVEGREVVKGVSLEVGAGEVVALMGPNGSGKSSLAYAIMGHPRYEVVGGKSSRISLGGESLLDMTPDERARAGVLMAFQHPIGVPGVKVKGLLLAAVRGRGEVTSALALRERVQVEADRLGIGPEMLGRGVNDGFSGGEKKKMETLQLKVLKPKIALVDEMDSGLDIDALKVVAAQLKELAQAGTGLLVITHYQRILKFLRPDRVVVLKEGRVVDEGGKELVAKLEREGYQRY